MCVCITSLCACPCVHTCTCLFTHTHMHAVCAYVYTHAHVRTHACVCMCPHIVQRCVFVYMCMCGHVSVHAVTHTYVYACAQTLRVHAHVVAYVCAHTCLHTHVHTRHAACVPRVQVRAYDRPYMLVRACVCDRARGWTARPLRQGLGLRSPGAAWKWRFRPRSQTSGTCTLIASLLCLLQVRGALSHDRGCSPRRVVSLPPAERTSRQAGPLLRPGTRPPALLLRVSCSRHRSSAVTSVPVATSNGRRGPSSLQPRGPVTAGRASRMSGAAGPDVPRASSQWTGGATRPRAPVARRQSDAWMQS